MSPSSLVFLPICALVAGALLQGLLARALSPRGKGWLALATALLALVGVLALWPASLRGQALDVRLLAWDGPASLAYHVDGLSLLFALMAAGIGSAVLLYSVDYMAGDPAATRFYALMLVFIAGLINLVFSADLLLLYLSWEVIGLCSFLLVGFWYRQREAASGARKVLVMTHLAGYALLAAIIALYLRTGTTLWTDPRAAAGFSTGLFVLMLVAAVAKSVQFPLHTWIPDAMAAPTPVSALLHAACYVKAGVYLVARLHSLGPWPAAWQTTVVWIGTVTMLVGVLYAVIQSDLKRLLAFHTVSQIGYMMLGLGLGTPLGIAAGLLHCLNHGLFKGGLFLCAGAVQHETGTRDMNRLGGLARRMPSTMVLWLIGAGSIAGVPLLSGFVSKWLLYNAALEAGQVVPALVSWVVSILTAFSFLKATSAVFLGEEGPDLARAGEAPRSLLAGGAVLAAGSVILGIFPQVAIRYIINPLLPALGLSPVIGVSWLGLTVASGGWYATGGAALAVIALVVALAVYWALRPGRRLAWAASPATASAALAGGGTAGMGAAAGAFTGGEPLSGPARVPASDFSAIVKGSLAPFYQWVDADRYYLALWRWLLRCCGWVGRLADWLEARAIPGLAVLCLLVALLAGLTASGGPVALASHAPSWAIVWTVAAAFLALLLAAAGTAQARPAVLLLMVAGLCALAGLMAEDALPRLALLELASVLALVLVWTSAGRRPAGTAYLLAVALSVLATGSGVLTLGAVPPGLSSALLMTGFALKLALVPLYLWLPMVAEETPATTAGLLVAVIDVAAFAELLALRGSAPWLFAPAVPWLALAVLSALGGGVLMLAQRNLKRLLAFSTIEDMGFLAAGLALGGELGLGGALAAAAAHALAKALLFSSVAAVEADAAPTLDQRGLAARHPWAGLGFVVGALAALGVPPLAGFAGHWRIYAAALQASPFLLAVLMLATALSLLAYARAVAVCWWGLAPAPDSDPGVRRPISPLLAAALAGLSVVVLLAGLWPAALGG